MEAVLENNVRVKPLRSLSKQSGVNKFIHSISEGIDSDNFEWIETIKLDDLKPISSEMLGLANSHRLNDVPRINKFLEKLPAFFSKETMKTVV